VALWLALTSCSKSLLDEVTAALDDANTETEARLHPLAIALSAGESEELKRDLTRRLMPTWLAAQALLERTFENGDRSLVVRVFDETEPLPPSCQQFAPEGPETTAEVRQARFLAWPHCASRWLNFSSQQTAREASRRLRSVIGRPETHIALVVEGGALSLAVDSRETKPEILRLIETLSSLVHLLRQHANAQLTQSLADIRRGPPNLDLPGLPLGGQSLLIVPKLSAVPERAPFLSEVEFLLRGVDG
jgi:hypothetical protein